MHSQVRQGLPPITSSSQTFLIAVCMFLFLANQIGLLPAQNAMAQQFQRYHFDTPIPLTVNTQQIAVYSSNADTINLSLLSETNLEFSKSQAHSISGWHILTFEKSNLVQINIADTLQRLPHNVQIDFVAPILEENGSPLIPTQDILIRFHENIGNDQQQQILSELTDLEIVQRNWANMNGAYKLRSNAHNGAAVLAQANSLAIRPEFRFAEVDMIFSGNSTLIPNDTFFADCWGLHNIGQNGACQEFSGVADSDMDAVEAWDITTGDPSILVLVIDTGVDQNHPDINQIPGADFTGEPLSGGPDNTCDNHGTPVAGCVSAIINNGLGTVGIAPDCRSVSARCFVSSLSCSGSWNAKYSWTADALAWAESMGVRVTNNSNQYGGSSAALEDKYAETLASGMVHFASAGNASNPFMVYPASLQTTISIGAIAPDGTLTGFSNHGLGLDLTAPGVDVVTTDRTGTAGWVDGDYTCAAGTSFASPYAAGIAALMLSVNPNLTSQEVEQIMKDTALDLGEPGDDFFYGSGLVRAHAALLASQPCDGIIGDIDNSGIVNLLDVQPFIDVLVNGSYLCEADINQDDTVNLLDVDGFVDLLTE